MESPIKVVKNLRDNVQKIPIYLTGLWVKLTREAVTVKWELQRELRHLGR